MTLQHRSKSGLFMVLVSGLLRSQSLVVSMAGINGILSMPAIATEPSPSSIMAGPLEIQPQPVLLAIGRGAYGRATVSANFRLKVRNSSNDTLSFALFGNSVRGVDSGGLDLLPHSDGSEGSQIIGKGVHVVSGDAAKAREQAAASMDDQTVLHPGEAVTVQVSPVGPSLAPGTDNNGAYAPDSASISASFIVVSKGTASLVSFSADDLAVAYGASAHAHDTAAPAAVSAEVPDAPQELLLRYLKTLNLTIEDANILDAFAANYLANGFAASEHNEVKRMEVRQAALDMIRAHKQSNRVMLGMTVTVGDYDTVKQRFHLLYPVYGTGATLPGSGMVTHYGPRAMIRSEIANAFRLYGCNSDPTARAPLEAPGYLEVFADCIQDDPQVRNFRSQPRTNSTSLPHLFKLIPVIYPAWNYLDMPPQSASALIDGLARTRRSIWIDMVFDIGDMMLPPSPALNIMERDNLRADLKMNAAFRIRPVAIFAWKLDIRGDRLLDENFLFSRGNVKLEGAPAGGNLTLDMIREIRPQVPTPTDAAHAIQSRGDGVGISRTVPPAPSSSPPVVDFGEGKPK